MCHLNKRYKKICKTSVMANPKRRLPKHGPIETSKHRNSKPHILKLVKPLFQSWSLTVEMNF